MEQVVSQDQASQLADWFLAMIEQTGSVPDYSPAWYGQQPATAQEGDAQHGKR